jgi:NAD(P)-dependent dehydrogenase (short-subunit alcohol dehydrogenase family)
MAVALLARSAGQIREVATAIEEQGGKALPVATDVTDRQQVAAAVEEIEKQLGPVDVLVNNAGSFDCIGPVAEIDPDIWWNDCEINLRGPLLTCHAVLPGMIRRGGGVIINVIGGGAGSPFAYGSGYASSKAGVMRLTECIAAEVREHGIVSFGMGPGFVRTTMTELQAESEAGQKYIPSSRRAMEEGRDIPPTFAADLAFHLATRREALAPLTGRLFRAGENLDEIIANIETIVAENKRTLRFF